MKKTVLKTKIDPIRLASARGVQKPDLRRLGGIEGIQPLRNGDHLPVSEFERRYWSSSEIKKAELIEGIVVMPSPVSRMHASAHTWLIALLGRYEEATPGVECLGNISIRLDGKNEYQPDVTLRIKAGKLAGSRVGEDDLIEGAPEFVAEIAVSSAGYDLHEKKSVYERMGIQEYFVWKVMDAQIHWFSLRNGAFVELKPGGGVIRSRTFPGLWLNVRELLADNKKKVSRSLDKGLESPEHLAFLKQLAKKEKN